MPPVTDGPQLARPRRSDNRSQCVSGRFTITCQASSRVRRSPPAQTHGWSTLLAIVIGFRNGGC